MKTKKLLKIFVIFDLIILVLLAAFLFLNLEKQKLDANVRKLAVGEFVELPAGFVHYELSGATEGDLEIGRAHV